ncbi:MAG: S8 family serine peptidase [Verrucomicrobiae bacterium]|nr:S8 family serine peptidase [Verrucomicrobiae bacterium]
MRQRPLAWFVLSLLCLTGAWYTWQWAEQRKASSRPAPPEIRPTVVTNAGASPARPALAAVRPASTAPLFMLTERLPETTAAATAETPKRDPLAHRLANTTRSVGELVREDRAILLENALIDTRQSLNFVIPEHLRSTDDPGSYVVQARGPVDENFRATLRAAGAAIVSYIPNHAYLVRVTAAGADTLRANPQTAAVLAYEPYYKLRGTLLQMAVQQTELPADSLLDVLVFSDARTETLASFAQQGVEVMAEERSPFGPVFTVRPARTGWHELARWPGVEVVELAQARVRANDLSRVRLGVSEDTLVATNHLELTGSNVLVNVNDTGVDAAHPDLAGRVFGDSPASLRDFNGHGTHVAGIIAGSGLSSTNPVNVGAEASGSVTNADFRGKAPGARIFSMAAGLTTGPSGSDAYLQESAARTNALISNNSWHFGNDNTYGIRAASYDAAVRDALPAITGSQPVLFVFPAGNAGAGNDLGLGGDSESVRSPGTAKNVITVGAIEQARDITNEVVRASSTNRPWAGMTSSDNQVAAFSGRGNTGIGREGDFGRFKPDLVAPGTFVISTRSTEWDEAAYYNPTNHHLNTIPDQVVLTNALSAYSLFVPQNAVAVYINVFPNADSPSPFPDLPIFVKWGDIAQTNDFDFVVTNAVAMPPDHGPALGPNDVGTYWFYSVGNSTTQNVSFNILTDIVTTNDLGNQLEVLSNLNNTLGPYRYESGTSMAAADVAGTLALMQEFFEQRLGVTNSPAFYKALLINGARSVDTLYDFAVRRSVNFQGWGLPSLANSLPVAQSNVLNGVTRTGPGSVILFDQSPTNALATGQSRTWRFSVTEEGRNLPLRVTLVWTDPPGNPVAGVKLVNNLDLVVTNLDTGDVYLGNDIAQGSNFTFPWNTNAPAELDVVNNVENVFVIPQLGSNYAVTVVGRHVNVNAVTAHPDDVAQDFALVISVGDGEVPDAMQLVETQPLVRRIQPTVTYVTNTFNSPTMSGATLLDQRVGANTPLLGTTSGMTNQWHFYVMTNTTSFTNATFMVGAATDLAIPRLGVREALVNNATRAFADVDLYVSTDPGLLNLDPTAIAAADKSLGRNILNGDEIIIYSNSVPGRVYYIGVKSEDQMAAEFEFWGVFSLLPLGAEDENGFVQAFMVPIDIPDGSNADPGRARLRALLFNSISGVAEGVRRVIVTNSVVHENFGDLLLAVSHDSRLAVLYNHLAFDPSFPPAPGPFQLLYEDNEEGDFPFALRSDGPGTLWDFVGEQPGGIWDFHILDDSLTQTGRVNDLRIKVERVPLEGAYTNTIGPNAWQYYSRDVPINATNLTVCVEIISPNPLPMQLYIRKEARPSQTEYDWTMPINPPGGCLSINKASLPPLTAGRYFIGLYNGNPTPQTYVYTAVVELGPEPPPITFQSTGDQPLLDDAVTYSSIFVNDRARIAEASVGLRVDHPRISDLMFTLISPQGTRVLLMESRGGTNSISAGTGILTTNVTTWENGFETVPAGLYPAGSLLEEWAVTSNSVGVLQNAAAAHTGDRALELRDGELRRNYTTVPGAYYEFSYAYRQTPTMGGLISWWPGESNADDIADGNHGTLVGDTTYGPGVVGQAFVLDGDKDGVNLGSPANLELSNFTIEAWIKRRSATEVSFDQELGPGGYILAFGDRGYGFGLIDGGYLLLTRVRDSAVISSGRITDTNWHHVAVTKSGGLINFYIDGLATVPRGYNPGFAFINPIGIGMRGDNEANSFYGAIDELAVFNRPLTGAEIFSIASAGSAGKCGMPAPPEVCASHTGRLVAGVINQPITALSTNWATNVISFQATQTNTPFVFQPVDRSGLLLDSFVLTETLVVTQNFYLTFTEDTNRASAPIKFAAPPYSSSLPPTNFLLSGFEPAAAGSYTAPDVVDGWSVLTSNRVAVLADPLLVHTGTKSLALLQGEIQRVLPTVFGRGYQLDFAYRQPPNLEGIVSWWPGDGNASDVVDGNHGTLVGSAAYGPGIVGTAFVLNGQRGSGVPVGLATNLQSPDFTIEAWIKRSSPSVASFDQVIGPGGVIYARGFGGPSFALFDNGDLFLTQVGIGWTSTGTGITDTNWNHVAITKSGDTVVFYLNGVPYLAPPYDPPFVFSSEAAIGARPDNGFSNPLYGSIDEPAYYNRVLSAAEIQDIYAAGAAGKCGMVTPPMLCALTGAEFVIPGILTNTFTGAATNWLTNSLSFVARRSATPLMLSPLPGGQSGILLDTFVLTEMESSVYYLPEESLGALRNENAYGEWRLEILDTRTGASNLTSLVDWQLQFVYQTEIPLPSILEHGVPVTNSVPPGQIAYHVVDVPSWAQFATNTLIFAAPTGVDVLFNQTTPPFGTNAGDFLLIGPTSTGGSRTLDLASVPPLVPGQRYYLGVSNGGPATVTYALMVEFDLTQLFDGVPVSSTVAVGTLPRYFYYDVSSNATAVSYQLLNLSGNADLVARQGAPPPTLTAFDYGSFNAGTNDEEIIVFTDSTPVALRPGHWYLGVYNTDLVPADYTILAIEYTNVFPTIVTLTNAIPYGGVNPGPANAMDYYRYRVSTNAVRAQFEINNASGDMTLLARKGLPLPDLATFDYQSTNAFPNDELIVVFDTSAPVPLSSGEWFLAAVNLTGVPVTYSITATEWPATGRPFAITNAFVAGNGFCFTWTSLPGVHYYVQGLTNLNSTNWVTLSPTITAVDYFTSWCEPPTSPFHFFRVVEGLALDTVVAAPVITSITHTNNTIVLEWTGPVSATYQVQWSPVLAPPSWTSFSEIVSSTTGVFRFVDDGTQTGGFGVTRYYRLQQLP